MVCIAVVDKINRSVPRHTERIIEMVNLVIVESPTKVDSVKNILEADTKSKRRWDMSVISQRAVLALI